MPGKQDLILAIAAYKVLRTTAPVIPPAGQATIEKQSALAKAQRAFERGEPVYDIQVDAELVGRFQGTAQIKAEGILEGELELQASHAIGILTRGIGERIDEQMAADVAAVAASQGPPPGNGQG